MAKSLPGKAIEDFWGCLSSILIIVTFLLPIGIIGVQVFSWLQTGVWYPLSIAIVAEAFYGYQFDYIYNATDWIGLAKVGKLIIEAPLSLMVFLFGWFLIEILD